MTRVEQASVGTEVIVIGAGAAGLMAATQLAQSGARVRVLEARERVGGRIHSVTSRGWPLGSELGPEFVHGGNAVVKKLLKQSGLQTRPIETKVWWQDSGTGVLALVPDYWERIGRVAARIPRKNQGRSFHEFLQRERGKIPAADCRLADYYVGGFNAAPTQKIAAHPLRADRAGAASEDLKLNGSYMKLMEQLHCEALAAGVDVKLNAPVERVTWKRGLVEILTRAPGERTSEMHRALMVVVTLPLGVLQSGRVKFYPRLGEKQKLIDKMGWGQVVRIVMRFKHGFWSAPFLPRAIAAKSGREFGFVNAPGQALPVWWALHAPTPVLTGWAGGERAEPLAGKSSAAVLEAALKSLAGIFGTTSKRLRPWLVDWKCHQWGIDPFALGAYSYPVAGWESAAEQLAEPLDSTIFFAGEATADEFGTVHGALASGERVAAEVLAARKFSWRTKRPPRSIRK